MKTILFLKMRLSIVALFLVLIFSGCDDNRVFEKNTDIENNVWDQKNIIFFEVNIEDTVSMHNMYLNVRNAGFYPFSNLFLYVSTRFPDGRSSKDTVEMILANPEGKWLGSGIGDIWDNQQMFRMRVRFPQKGEYVFGLEQGMRVTQLPGIMDVGIRIERNVH